MASILNVGFFYKDLQKKKLLFQFFEPPDSVKVTLFFAANEVHF